MNTFFLIWFCLLFVLYLARVIFLIKEDEQDIENRILIAIYSLCAGCVLSLIINVLTIWK